MKMLNIRNHFLFILLALTMTLPAAGQVKPKHQAAGDTPKLGDQRQTAYFDISKIVWPNPPAIARIKFVDLRTGQKVDPNQFAKSNRKDKQKWMDRLAGSTPVDQIDTSKLPYQLIRTYGVAVDSKGTIYAADQAVGAIFLFDSQGTKSTGRDNGASSTPKTAQLAVEPDSAKAAAQSGAKPGSGGSSIHPGVELIRNGADAHFGLINGLAIDDDDRLFVTDVKLNRVLVFNAKHKLETAFGGDVLSNPGGMAIDTENRFVYVVDTGNDVVRVFDADTFKLLRTIGKTGKKHTLNDPGTFSLPTNVALDADGNVYVTDTMNWRVEVFDADGNFISQFGKHGDGVGQFEIPKGIAVDCDGHIWVVDAMQDRIKVYDRDGQLLIYFGEHGEYPGRFMGAFGITIDRQNRVIVSETFPGRVQIFQYVSDAEFEKEKLARTGGAKQAPGKAVDATKSKGSAAETPQKISAVNAGSDTGRPK